MQRLGMPNQRGPFKGFNANNDESKQQNTARQNPVAKPMTPAPPRPQQGMAQAGQATSQGGAGLAQGGQGWQGQAPQSPRTFIQSGRTTGGGELQAESYADKQARIQQQMMGQSAAQQRGVSSVFQQNPQAQMAQQQAMAQQLASTMPGLQGPKAFNGGAGQIAQGPTPGLQPTGPAAPPMPQPNQINQSMGPLQAAGSAIQPTGNASPVVGGQMQANAPNLQEQLRQLVQKQGAGRWGAASQVPNYQGGVAG